MQQRLDGVISKAALDQSRATAQSANAAVERAQKEFDSAEENQTKAVIYAPVSGIVNAVQAESFATVAAGSPIVSLYSDEALEASFSVSYEVIQQLAVGRAATIVLADSPDIELDAVVTELGSRADTVSSFPVVVALTESSPSLKAGMAVGVSIKFKVPLGGGFTLPLHAASLSANPSADSGRDEPLDALVFVYDEATSTVKQRAVKVIGVTGSDLIVIAGVEAGERVASAGVSFLRDGQQVKLITEVTDRQ